MIQKDFANRATEILQQDPDVLGLAVGGSWIHNELDEFSDLDLILITRNKVSDDPSKMLQYAKRLGSLLNGFTGEHVGEPRLLVCLYNSPLLHVDIKFLTLEEVTNRVETPELLLDSEGKIKSLFSKSEAAFPYPDYQWIEDRFWIWVHYLLQKMERGEYMEAVDGFAFLRMTVFGPLLHIKNGSLPRGIRKVETELSSDDLEQLKSTIATYGKASILNTMENSINLYKSLRTILFDKAVHLQKNTENRVLEYIHGLKG